VGGNLRHGRPGEHDRQRQVYQQHNKVNVPGCSAMGNATGDRRIGFAQWTTLVQRVQSATSRRQQRTSPDLTCLGIQVVVLTASDYCGVLCDRRGMTNQQSQVGAIPGQPALWQDQLLILTLASSTIHRCCSSFSRANISITRVNTPKTYDLSWRCNRSTISPG